MGKVRHNPYSMDGANHNSMKEGTTAAYGREARRHDQVGIGSSAASKARAVILQVKSQISVSERGRMH